MSTQTTHGDNGGLHLTPGDVSTYYANRAPGVSQTTAGHWRGPCPIHKGTRDSFSVDAETGQWFCHSECGRGGDVISLEEALTGADFKESLESVRDLVGKQEGQKPDRRGRPRRDGSKIVAAYDYTDEEGKLIFQVVRKEPKGFSQRKPKPGGKGWEYSIKGVRIVPFRLPKVLESDYVFVVEGEKDVQSLEALDLVATCNPMGAGKWRAEFNPHFAGRRVYILPDSDAPGRRHAADVAAQLLPVAASVRIVDVPEGHKDISNWISAGAGLAEIRAACVAHPELTADLLEEWKRQNGLVLAEAPISRPDDDAGPWPNEAEEEDDSTDATEAADAPPKRPKANATAEQILQREKFLCDDSLAIYRYSGTHWKETSVWAMRKLALDAEGPIRSTERRRSEIVGYIRAKSHVPAIRWRQLGRSEVPFVNGVLDILTGEMRPHRAEDMLETVLPHKYEPEAECPTWLAALRTYWGTDRDYEAKVLVLQEFFGYCLLPHAKYKRALICQGESDTGKSQIAYVLRQLVGNENCSSVSVEDLDDPRKRVPLIGKMLNVLTELTSKAVVADGGFKTFVSTEEPLQFDPKFLKPILYTPTAKHVIICNDLPQVTDRSMGTYNRMIMLRFSRVLAHSDQDRDFQDKLAEEILGIARWAVEGARRLVENGGQFTRVFESEHLVAEYRESQNDIYGFIAERCDVHPLEYTEKLSRFAAKFREWSANPKNVPQVTLGKLKSAGYRIEWIEEEFSGRKVQMIVGLRLSDAN